MFGPGKLQQMKRMMKNPAEAEPIQQVASIIAEIERAQTEAINDLGAALDAEDVGAPGLDKDARREEILALVNAMTPKGDSITDWYVDHRLDFDGDREQIVAYVETAPESWAKQMEARDREEMDALVRDRFGAPSLEWFEANVIEVSTSDIIREGMAGRLTRIEDSISRAADVARE